MPHAGYAEGGISLNRRLSLFHSVKLDLYKTSGSPYPKDAILIVFVDAAHSYTNIVEDQLLLLDSTRLGLTRIGLAEQIRQTSCALTALRCTLEEALTAFAAAIAALVDGAATANGCQTSHQTALVTTAAALLRRRLLLVLHGLLLLLRIVAWVATGRTVRLTVALLGRRGAISLGRAIGGLWLLRVSSTATLIVIVGRHDVQVFGTCTRRSSCAGGSVKLRRKCRRNAEDPSSKKAEEGYSGSKQKIKETKEGEYAGAERFQEFGCGRWFGRAAAAMVLGKAWVDELACQCGECRS